MSIDFNSSMSPKVDGRAPSAGRSLVATVAVATAILLRAPLSAQTPAYVVTQIPGDAEQVSSAINNLGDITGRSVNPKHGQTRATLWAGGKHDVRRLRPVKGGEYSVGLGINDTREVVGSSNAATSLVPFIWTPTAGMRRVPLQLGHKAGEALSVNKFGHVAGYSSSSTGTSAFLWARSKKRARPLPALPGGTYSRARHINDADEVVGTSGSSAGKHAVLWTSAGVHDLGTLPGDTSSEAVAINNSGDVVGYSAGPDGTRAFLWTKRSGMRGLATLPGGSNSRAAAINDARVVVGSSSSKAGDHAFIWTPDSGMQDLNGTDSAAMRVLFIEAHAINASGQILVTGRGVNEPMPSSPGEHECEPAPPTTFLLTPTP